MNIQEQSLLYLPYDFLTSKCSRHLFQLWQTRFNLQTEFQSSNSVPIFKLTSNTVLFVCSDRTIFCGWNCMRPMLLSGAPVVRGDEKPKVISSVKRVDSNFKSDSNQLLPLCRLLLPDLHSNLPQCFRYLRSQQSRP